ncbi:MAG: GNAT family N-acetyltransferase [Pseudomonadales bacterium]|nr:GNAT family N-acetyltransferase [Pseudomonadales bacterium]MDP6471090.1 GNAT family N-acetyltransferase [Pseudomonadales bacterium]MDP6825724.1 GNAT family N-acetyltransferase [Pseudomonadales bacterium]MDP6973180.1 GNAT family N-acetyltransferase [Pseudomonadales bacterium]
MSGELVASPRLPRSVTSGRLTLRVPEAADVLPLDEAVMASFPELQRWMEWAVEPVSRSATAEFVEHAQVVWRKDEEWPVLMIDGDGVIAGASGYPNIDWSVPSFEIGYWVCTSEVGKGGMPARQPGR